MTMYLADALASDQQNNLNLLRLTAAMAVIVSHAWPLSQGEGTPEPLQHLTGVSLGGWALYTFFLLSGFLITASAERRTCVAFWRARVRRIMPGLAFASFVAVAFALLSGAEPSFGEAALYIVRSLSLFSIEHRLPEAYAGNPLPLAVNGPLWSLSHEITAYAVCHIAVLTRVHERNPWAVLLFAAILTIMPLPSARAEAFADLFLPFVLGMLAWRLRVQWPLTIPFLFLFLLLAPFAWFFSLLALAQLVLLAAFRLPSRNVKSDVSYGLYLLGWPVGQFLMHMRPDLGPVDLALASLAATLPLAWISWELVERPFLERSKGIGP